MNDDRTRVEVHESAGSYDITYVVESPSARDAVSTLVQLAESYHGPNETTEDK